MISNKKILLATLVSTLAVGGSVITANTIADAAANQSSTTYRPLVQKIADKFDLNPADVQQVFDDQKSQNATTRQQKVKSVLDQDVKDGKITQAQEDKIIAKLEELRDTRLNDRRLDKKADRIDFRSQINQWLKDNGINTTLDDLLPHPKDANHFPAEG